MKKNKVDYVQGWGKFLDKNTVEATGADGSKTIIKTKNTIIACKLSHNCFRACVSSRIQPERVVPMLICRVPLQLDQMLSSFLS